MHTDVILDTVLYPGNIQQIVKGPNDDTNQMMTQIICPFARDHFPDLREIGTELPDLDSMPVLRLKKLAHLRKVDARRVAQGATRAAGAAEHVEMRTILTRYRSSLN